MQKTSALYRKILAGIHTKETRVSIGDTGFLVDKRGNGITFGGTRILVGASGADAGYGMNILASVETTGAIFDGNEPTVGNVISRECDIKMLKPSGNIEGMSRIAVYVRLVSGNGECSEWLPQGVFYADSIDQDADEDDVQWLKIHGYDAILFAEQDYPADSKLTWPAKDIDVVREIAQAMGVTVEPRTAEIMRNAYPVQYNPEYTCREYLGYIAAMYAGCFLMSESGELLLVCFWNIPKETRYLIDTHGYAITFGGDRIVV